MPLRLLILLLSLFGSVIMMPIRHSRRTFRRSIHSERQVIMADFIDTDLPTVIHSQGWKSLCDVSVICPLVLIQEFYSNMHGIDRSVPLFFTRV